MGLAWLNNFSYFFPVATAIDGRVVPRIKSIWAGIRALCTLTRMFARKEIMRLGNEAVSFLAKRRWERLSGLQNVL